MDVQVQRLSELRTLPGLDQICPGRSTEACPGWEAHWVDIYSARHPCDCVACASPGHEEESVTACVLTGHIFGRDTGVSVKFPGSITMEALVA